MNELRFNPFGFGTADELANVLLDGCEDNLSAPQVEQLARGVRAIIPALVELRDAGLLQLNARVVAEYSTLEGLTRLSDDSRLSVELRTRYTAARQQMLVETVREKVLERWTSQKLQ